jgi:hypothetical protein
MVSEPQPTPTSLSVLTSQVSDGWDQVLPRLPPDLDAIARKTGLIRRVREFSGGAPDLLRLAMMFALHRFSLRGLAHWAGEVGIADVSDVAVLKQLVRMEPFLLELISYELAKRRVRPPSGMRLTIVDSSTITPVGGGPAWRLHTTYEGVEGRIVGVRLTPESEGESFDETAFLPGDLVIADRGYASSSRFAAAHAAKAMFLVRSTWNLDRLRKPDGTPVVPLDFATNLERGGVADHPVDFVLRTGEKLRCRLIVARKNEGAERAELKRVARITKQAKKRELTPESEKAAGYWFLLTTAPLERASATDLIEAYRFRWQVELLFKRMKGLLHLDEVRKSEGGLAKTFILTQILCALIIETALPPGAVFPPQQPRSPRGVEGLAGSGDLPETDGVGPRHTRLTVFIPRPETLKARRGSKEATNSADSTGGYGLG